MKDSYIIVILSQKKGPAKLWVSDVMEHVMWLLLIIAIVFTILFTWDLHIRCQNATLSKMSVGTNFIEVLQRSNMF